MQTVVKICEKIDLLKKKNTKTEMVTKRDRNKKILNRKGENKNKKANKSLCEQGKKELIFSRKEQIRGVKDNWVKIWTGNSMYQGRRTSAIAQNP